MVTERDLEAARRWLEEHGCSFTGDNVEILARFRAEAAAEEREACARLCEQERDSAARSAQRHHDEDYMGAMDIVCSYGAETAHELAQKIRRRASERGHGG